MWKHLGFIVVLCATALTACSGGGSNGPIISPAPSPSATSSAGSKAPQLTQSVSFTVLVPASTTVQSVAKRSLAARKSRSDGTTPYISPNIASIAIALQSVNGVTLPYPPPAPTVSNISCSTPSTGCSVTVGNVTAGVGTNRYLVTTYALAGGPATANNVVISSQLLDVVVTGNGTVNTTLGDPSQLAIGGFVNALALTNTQMPNPLALGVAGSGTILVTAKDVTGATIVGNAQFPNPIVLRANGVALTGVGLQSDGSYVLTMPETTNATIGFTYAGTGSSISITATTTGGVGGALPISATLMIPVNTATAPPASPSPPPTPTAAPTPATGPPSLYVINAGNDSLVEYALSPAGMPTNARRVLTSPTFGCPSNLTEGYQFAYGLTGLTVDSFGTVYAATSGNTCGNAGFPRLYPIASSAAAGPFDFNTVAQFPLANPDIELQFDPSFGGIDFNPDGQGYSPALSVPGGAYAYAQVAFTPPTGSALAVVGAVAFGTFGDQTVSSFPCFTSSGFGPASSSCAVLTDTNGAPYGQNFANGNASYQFVFGNPLAATGTGTTYFATDDADHPTVEIPGQTLNAYSTSIASYANSANRQSIGGMAPGVASPTWIEGLDTLLDPRAAIAAMTYDPTTRRLYVLHASSGIPGPYWLQVGSPNAASNARPDFCTDADGSNMAQTPLCTDLDPHYYILGFDLSATPATEPCTTCGYPPGALDLRPVLVISGDKLHLPPYIDEQSGVLFGQNLIPQNGFTAFNGKLYLTNPIGPTCDSACVAAESNGLAPTSGEIDVYDGTATGYFGNTNQGGVFVGAFKDANLGVPVGLAFGAQGTVTTSVVRPRGIVPLRAGPARRHVNLKRYASRR